MPDLAHPQARNRLLLGVLLVGGLGYLGREHVYRPRAEAVAAMEERLETLELRNRAARRLAEGEAPERAEARLRVRREQLGRVEALVPSAEELPDLLDAISAEAQRSGVELTRIRPAGATLEAFYTRRTYQLALLGSYHQIGEFLTRVGSLPRIVIPISLDVTVREVDARTGNPGLEAELAIETYVVPAAGLAADTLE